MWQARNFVISDDNKPKQPLLNKWHKKFESKKERSII